MPLRTDWSQENCPVARGADVLGDPWVILILREIFVGHSRFEAIRSELGVADNILSNRLRRLVESGLLRQEAYGNGVRPRKEYRLTEAGADVLPVLHALISWAEKHTVSPSGRSITVYCRVCGTSSTNGMCSTCDAELVAGATEWDRPSAPGQRVVIGAS
jgi:DNA-binding HxlR family transcriptional regulator